MYVYRMGVIAHFRTTLCQSTLTKTHWLRYRQDGTVASPATVLGILTVNDPLSQNFTTKWREHFKTTNSGNENVHANYHR